MGDVNRHITVAQGSFDLTTTLLARYLEKRFVPGLKARLLIHLLGVESTLPEGNGINVGWNLVSTPAPDTTAINATATNEGDDPADTALTSTRFDATLKEYGGNFKFSKMFIRAALSGTMDQVVDRMQYKAAISLDSLAYAAADDTTTSVNSGTALTVDAIRQGVAVLEGSGTLNSGMALPHPKSPGGKYFILAASPEAAYDMIGEGSPTFSQVKSRDVESAFTTPLQDTPDSAGVYGAIVKITSVATRNTATSPDDDQNVLVGSDAFGVASLDDATMDPRVIVTMPDQLVSAPARNRGTVAYWFLYASTNFDSKRSALILSDATGVG